MAKLQGAFAVCGWCTAATGLDVGQGVVEPRRRPRGEELPHAQRGRGREAGVEAGLAGGGARGQVQVRLRGQLPLGALLRLRLVSIEDAFKGVDLQGRAKNWALGLVNLLTTSASTCLRKSRNLGLILVANASLV